MAQGQTGQGYLGSARQVDFTPGTGGLDPVFWYRSDGSDVSLEAGTENSIKRFASSPNHGSLGNNIAQSVSVDRPHQGEFREGEAAHFDGISQYLEYDGADTDFNDYSHAEDLTLALLLKVTGQMTDSALYALVDNINYSAAAVGYTYSISSDGTIQCTLGNAGAGGSVTWDRALDNVRESNCLVVLRDGATGDHELFVNGVSKGTRTLFQTSSANASQPFTIANGGITGHEFLPCFLPEVIIYNEKLQASEVELLTGYLRRWSLAYTDSFILDEGPSVHDLFHGADAELSVVTTSGSDITAVDDCVGSNDSNAVHNTPQLLDGTDDDQSFGGADSFGFPDGAIQAVRFDGIVGDFDGDDAPMTIFSIARCDWQTDSVQALFTIANASAADVWSALQTFDADDRYFQYRRDDGTNNHGLQVIDSLPQYAPFVAAGAYDGAEADGYIDGLNLGPNTSINVGTMPFVHAAIGAAYWGTLANGWDGAIATSFLFKRRLSGGDVAGYADWARRNRLPSIPTAVYEGVEMNPVGVFWPKIGVAKNASGQVVGWANLAGLLGNSLSVRSSDMVAETGTGGITEDSEGRLVTDGVDFFRTEPTEWSVEDHMNNKRVHFFHLVSKDSFAMGADGASSDRYYFLNGSGSYVDFANLNWTAGEGVGIMEYIYDGTDAKVLMDGVEQDSVTVSIGTSFPSFTGIALGKSAGSLVATTLGPSLYYTHSSNNLSLAAAAAIRQAMMGVTIPDSFWNHSMDVVGIYYAGVGVDKTAGDVVGWQNIAGLVPKTLPATIMPRMNAETGTGGITVNGSGHIITDGVDFLRTDTSVYTAGDFANSKRFHVFLKVIDRSQFAAALNNAGSERFYWEEDSASYVDLNNLTMTAESGPGVVYFRYDGTNASCFTGATTVSVTRAVGTSFASSGLSLGKSANNVVATGIVCALYLNAASSNLTDGQIAAIISDMEAIP